MPRPEDDEDPEAGGDGLERQDSRYVPGESDEEAEADAGGGEDENSFEGKEEEDGDDEQEDDEEGEEEDDDYDDDYEEEEEEEEEDDEEDPTSETSDAHETLTTVSNETEPSDDMAELEETERQTAVVIAGPPWSGLLGSCLKALAACMLPVMLVLLLIYGFVKFWTYSFQCLFDLVHLAVRIVWVAVRLALSPLYLLYRACVPGYVQRTVADFYAEYIKDSVDWVLGLLKLGESIITDLPNYTAACSHALLDTVEPARARCSACIFRLFGRRAEEWVLTPWHDQEIMRGVKRRKAQLERSQLSDPAVRDAMKKLGPRRRRAKARAKRERAKRLRQRKKMEAREITLMLPINDKSRHHHHDHGFGRVQLPERPRSKMVTRVATVERGYAIGVGVVWCMIGATILAITLTGVDGERCLICSERQDISLRVCRHGVGRDCAFDLHMREIVAGIAVITVGGLLTVYAICLYKPRKKAQKAVNDEEDKKREAAERKKRQLVKDVDPELAAVQLLLEQLNRPGFGQTWRRRYYRLLEVLCVACIVRCAERLLRRFFRFEREHDLLERSIVLQNALHFMAIGWLQALSRFLSCARPEDQELPKSARRVSRFSMRTATRLRRDPEAGCAAWLKSFIRRLRGIPEAPPEKFTAGVGASVLGRHGPNLLEDVLHRFGLAGAEAAPADLAADRRLSFSSRGPEEQREFGLEEVDANVPEEEPRFHVESDPEAKDSGTDEEDGDARGWRTEDELAAEALDPEWQEQREAQDEKPDASSESLGTSRSSAS